MSAPAIALAAVEKRFGRTEIIRGVSLEIPAGERHAVIGPNGAGKSTLFNVVSGFLSPERGSVQFEGRRIDHAPSHQIARRGLVRTFQVPRALTRLSVLDNVLLAAPHHPGERLSSLLFRPARARAREQKARRRAHELLELFRLDRHARDYAGVLSGGQRKLLDFARVLMAEPRLVLLDEPMAGVNPVLGRQLLEHVLQLRAAGGMTFLFVEHDLDVVMEASDRV
ncbi:MAG: ABC transporter ATP-binding protein, partial [Microvirga sp.]